MVRRLIQAEKDSTFVDDPHNYGNKRYILAGSLMASLFETCFVRINKELRLLADKQFAKGRGYEFDIVRIFKPDMMTLALESPIQTVRKNYPIFFYLSTLFILFLF